MKYRTEFVLSEDVAHDIAEMWESVRDMVDPAREEEAEDLDQQFADAMAGALRITPIKIKSE